MDFDLDEQQLALRELTRRVLVGRGGTAWARRAMALPNADDPEAWRAFADAGLLGATIPTTYGGSGLGLVEGAVIHEELGRTCVPGPYFATVGLAATALALAGGPAAERFLPAIVRGELRATLAFLEPSGSWGAAGIGLSARRTAGGYLLHGAKRFVPDAEGADLLLVAARTAAGATTEDGITLFAVPRGARGVEIRTMRSYDPTDRPASVDLSGVAADDADVIGVAGRGWLVLEPLLRRAAVLAAAEMLGAARRSLELAVEYAKVREQFGQPVGSFQAVKHACANMLVEVENCHLATYYAAWAHDAGAPDAARAASVAKAYVADASREVIGTALQVHGGIGFTWDHDLHLLLKRAKRFEPLYGDADHHRERALRESLALHAAPSAER